MQLHERRGQEAHGQNVPRYRDDPYRHSNQYLDDPNEVYMRNRNDNRAFYSDMPDFRYNRGHVYSDPPAVHTFKNPRDASHVKIPSFTGKEDWAVWITRFEAIADRMRWDESDMLDQILPRIEGQAAENIFSQLRPAALRNYTELNAEINNQY
jgi:hypothetical protein